MMLAFSTAVSNCLCYITFHRDICSPVFKECLDVLRFGMYLAKQVTREHIGSITNLSF